EPPGEATEVDERAVEERLRAVAPVEVDVRVDEDWPVRGQGARRLHGLDSRGGPGFVDYGRARAGSIFGPPGVRTHFAPHDGGTEGPTWRSRAHSGNGSGRSGSCTSRSA